MPDLHVALFFLLLSIASSHALGEPLKFEPGKVYRDGGTLFIQGVIVPGMDEAARALIDSAVNTVVLTSEGGETGAAIAIGELISANKLNVVVRRFCISSCANYLFVAGYRKRVEAGSILAWHGGHSNNPFPRDIRDEKLLKRAQELLRREQVLYLRSGTSLDLIIYSGFLTTGHDSGKKQIIEFGGVAREVSIFTRDYTHWIPKRETLKQLGVKNIVEFWHPGSDSAASEKLKAMGFSDFKAYTGSPYSYVPLMFR
jgi:hypothetical protein